MKVFERDKTAIYDLNDQRKIAIYCRVSTREQALKGYSIRDQESRVEEYLRYVEVTNDISYSGIVKYIEPGRSAKNSNRRELQKMYGDIRKGDIKCIAISRSDRIIRTHRDLDELLDYLEKYNVCLISLYERIDTTTAVGRFQLRLSVSLSQFEIENLGERTIKGIDRSAHEGNYAKAHSPYGFAKRRVAGKLIPKKSEAPIIKLIFDKMASGSYSLTSLAAYLRVNKIGDRKWNDEILKAILINPIYYGEYSNDRVKIENHTTPLIEKSVFLLAGKMLKQRTRVPRHKYLYRGLMSCFDCDCRFELQSTNKKNKTYLYYYCSRCSKRVSEEKLNKVFGPELAETLVTNGRRINQQQLTQSISKLQVELYELEQSIESYKGKEREAKIDEFISLKKSKLNSDMSMQNPISNYLEWFSKTYSEKRAYLLTSIDRIYYSFNERKLSIKFKGTINKKKI